ncbi:dihydrolipoyltranssuccinase [Candidatus Methylobacter favarea]|uniref:Dihydrolipoyllysine-residue succinyltransferase component of 2-oxoglutarate dehydrogenase complex n=1 Tax=Candidatus Methylobacter favarea TaxID=2707345 RepID=A0A8S0X951_9GAMM|nr:2-oxoglutarate dehydrogenase complex dihydrolipoyllysine-residue succinyltransferase [Candidatus Methylobacter favarea]CAA9891854.1 dihydrolipoyltranssuccinase [Candidatus Methylobacter favarea]
MSIEVLVPPLPESVSDATLINWHKQAGETVTKNDNLVDLETDKVVLEVPAPATGTVSKIIKENGAIVTSGELLAVIETQAGASPPKIDNESPKLERVESGEDNESKTAEHEESDTPLSPSVRRLIMENKLDPAQINGTGKDGRLTKMDVLDYLNKQSSDKAANIASTEAKPETGEDQAKPETAKQQAKPETAKELEPAAPASNLRPEQRVAMTRLRAKVAERLLQAQRNAAMLTTFNEVNMQSVIDLRNQYKSRFEQKHQVKLGFMSFFVKASIEALKRFPAINASIDDNDIIYHGYYDLGIAVSTPRGLIVPVLKDADQLDFAGIEKSITDFGEKARTGALTYEDLKGGTFTITNGGVFGSMLSTPILNPPQCAILGMHAIKERPVVEQGQVVVRPIMYLALSYDHRLVDGREAVQFLVTIKECLEAPAHLLLNI